MQIMNEIWNIEKKEFNLDIFKMKQVYWGKWYLNHFWFQYISLNKKTVKSLRQVTKQY